MTQKITALFAGGCFWCMQPAFDITPGVLETAVGYAGGPQNTANYDAVCSGRSGQIEAIQVSYDPTRVSYEDLLKTFWENIDPTQSDGQFADRGSQYMTAIYYADQEQRLAAELSKESLSNSGKFDRPIVTKILPAPKFYSAEEYHQKYYQKNPEHYEQYSWGSGRKGFIKKVWGK